jgi:crossover junction endodeoxyribonuclease RusA
MNGIFKLNEFNFTLPWPPSINSYWRHANGHTYISKKGKSFRKSVIAQIKILGLDLKLKDRVSVRIVANAPDRRKRDIDNVLKSTLDSLIHANFIVDDEQVDQLSVERGKIVKGGEIILKIRVLE